MKTKTVGLALCQHSGSSGKFLFQMPRYSNLKPGDLVIVDTKHGEQEARVIVTETMYTDGDDYRMILAATGATLPLRKYRYLGSESSMSELPQRTMGRILSRAECSTTMSVGRLVSVQRRS